MPIMESLRPRTKPFQQIRRVYNIWAIVMFYIPVWVCILRDGEAYKYVKMDYAQC
ncbi:hypothetical protein DL98DRAFT_511675 [Cadophora sp. DSE1049]|nr:hypothetical protein DL98DRAFT_511675 [Cadophora sp. DSE1049]